MQYEFNLTHWISFIESQQEPTNKDGIIWMVDHITYHIINRFFLQENDFISALSIEDQYIFALLILEYESDPAFPGY